MGNEKKDLWTIREILDVLEKAGMEVYSINQILKRKTEYDPAAETCWTITIRQ